MTEFEKGLAEVLRPIVGEVHLPAASAAAAYVRAYLASDAVVERAVAAALIQAQRAELVSEREVINWQRDRITQLEEQYIDLKAQLLEARAALAGTDTPPPGNG